MLSPTRLRRALAQQQQHHKQQQHQQQQHQQQQQRRRHLICHATAGAPPTRQWLPCPQQGPFRHVAVTAAVAAAHRTPHQQQQQLYEQPQQPWDMACASPAAAGMIPAADIITSLQQLCHQRQGVQQEQEHAAAGGGAIATLTLLLHHAAPSATLLTPDQLVGLLQAAAEVVVQEHQQHQQSHHQQEQLHHQQVPAAGPAAAVITAPVLPAAAKRRQQQQQHEQLEQQRQQWLRLQQQQQQQHVQQQQHQGSAQQEKMLLWQQREPALQVLAAVLQSWVAHNASAPVSQQTLQLDQLAALLNACSLMQLVPPSNCVLQLCAAAGLEAPQHQHQQHQQQHQQQQCQGGAQGSSAADAAHLLQQMIGLLLLAHWQPHCCILQASPLAGGVQLRNPLAPALQQHLEQLLILQCLLPSAQPGGRPARADGMTMTPFVAALEAVEQLNAVMVAESRQLVTWQAAWSSSSSGGGGSANAQASDVSGLILSASTLKAMMAAVVPRPSRQLQHAQQHQPRPGKQPTISTTADALVAMRCIAQLCSQQHQFYHEQQQQLAGGARDSTGTHDVVKPMHLRFWLADAATDAFRPGVGLATAPASELSALLALLAWRGVGMPAWWLPAAEAAVAASIQELCRAVQQAGQAAGAEASGLLHAWVLLVQAQPKRARSRGGSGGSNSRSSSSSKGRDWHFCRGARFVTSVAAAFGPVLPALDAASLAEAALALSALNPPQEARVAWVPQLLHAAEAAAHAATPHMQSTAGDTTSSSGSTSTSSSGGGGTGNDRLPAEAVLQLLQAMLLMRVQPPLQLLEALLAAMCRDMVLLRGSVLVSLLLVLAQLRYRPSAAWLRMVLLRLQGKLRMLCFDELTQLCWCLVQMGVRPPQAWQDDLMDAAAGPVLAERQRQQQGRAWFRHQQQQQQRGGAQPSDSSSQGVPLVERPRGHPSVHVWQLRVLHWAVLQCWHYRSSHGVGKQHWRLVRELNRAAWSQLATRPARQQPAATTHAGLARQRYRAKAQLRAAAWRRQRLKQQQLRARQHKLWQALRAGFPGAAVQLAARTQPLQRLLLGRRRRLQVQCDGRSALRSTAEAQQHHQQQYVSRPQRVPHHVMQPCWLQDAVWPKQWRPAG